MLQVPTAGRARRSPPRVPSGSPGRHFLTLHPAAGRGRAARDLAGGRRWRDGRSPGERAGAGRRLARPYRRPAPRGQEVRPGRPPVRRSPARTPAQAFRIRRRPFGGPPSGPSAPATRVPVAACRWTTVRIEPCPPRTLALLGSTGSIGTQAVDVVERNPDRFRVVALAASGGRPGLLAEQAARLRVGAVASRTRRRTRPSGPLCGTRGPAGCACWSGRTPRPRWPAGERTSC